MKVFVVVWNADGEIGWQVYGSEDAARRDFPDLDTEENVWFGWSGIAAPASSDA